MYLIDTNVVAEARRGRREAVVFLQSVDPDGVFLSVVTLGEVMRGAALKQKDDPAAAARLIDWLEALRRGYAKRILPITDAVALEWGRLAALRPRGDADGFIAATAIVHNLVLVTRNVADFCDTRAPLINPWETS